MYTVTDKTIQIGVEGTDGNFSTYTLPIYGNKVYGVLNNAIKARRIIPDTNIRNIELSPVDNERTIL